LLGWLVGCFEFEFTERILRLPFLGSACQSKLISSFSGRY
jgi:hypothetical protein